MNLRSLKVVKRRGAAAAAFAVATMSPTAARAQELLFELATDTPYPRNRNEAFGVACLGLPDVDGDGAADLLIGANWFGKSNGSNEGAVFVLSGATQTKLRKHLGSSNGWLGTSIDGGLDVDGDGIADYIAGEPFAVVSGIAPGLVHVYSGATRLELWQVAGQQHLERLGDSVALIPDIDQDGRADVVATAPSWDDPVSGNIECGRGYCWSGSTGALLWTLDGVETFQQLMSCSALGDLDGDGIVEVGFGSTGPGGTGTRPGMLEIVRGSDGALFRTLVGLAANDEFGTVHGCGDLDRDGVDDLLVGAAGANPFDEGRVSAHSGRTGSELHRWDGILMGGRFKNGAQRALRDWDGDGFADALIGHPRAILPDCSTGDVELRSGRTGRLLFDYRGRNDLGLGPSMGTSCSVVGDLNGDGIPEIMVGADSAGIDVDGRVYVFAGDDRFLQADQSDYDLNDPITIELRGGTPGLLGLIALTELDGVPLFSALAVAPMNADGELVLTDLTDATYLGHSVRLKGWCVPPSGRGKLLDSNEEWFSF